MVTRKKIQNCRDAFAIVAMAKKQLMSVMTSCAVRSPCAATSQKLRPIAVPLRIEVMKPKRS